MPNNKRQSLEQQIRDGKIGFYMCDPSCGLRFLLPKDGEHTCSQCNREPIYMREAKLSDLK